MKEIKEIISLIEKGTITTDEIKEKLKLSDSEIANIFLDDLISKNARDNGNWKLELKDVSYSPVKNKKTLDNVNFSIYPGKFHAFIGENGAGKSTTIKIIVGLIDKYTGSILLNDEDIREKETLRSKMCFIPDQTSFPSNLSIFNYLYNLTRLMTDFDKDYIIEQIDTLLEKFSLLEIKNKNPNKISTGQKQKVLLISAILQRPNLIILDEPFANLDLTTRYMFMEELKKLQDAGITIFLSTHILDEIKDYANYVTFLRKGNVLMSKELTNKDEILAFYKENYIDNKDDRREEKKEEN